MIRFNDYLDKLSIVKVLSFFLLVMLILTLIPMIFNFNLGSLFFKLVLYAVMLVFFVYLFKKIDFKENNDNSFLLALKNEYNLIFDVSDIYQVSFIVIANILFVSAIYFVLKYLSAISFIHFDSSLFGDFTALGIDALLVYLLAVVILSPIIEEILFRGVILRRFNMEMNSLTLAILISSILFGICHNFGAILFGICASILYIKSRNILVPILAHFLNNLASFLLALSGIENFIQGSSIAIALIIILAIISNFVLFRAILKEWPKEME